MIAYEVGKQFPHEKYLNRGEIVMSIINEKFVDVICCLSNPTSDEVNTFKKGHLTVYLYEKFHVPFLIFDLGGNLNFDVSIDITKIPEDKQDEWLNEDANLITLFLVDAQTGILKAMRAIGLSGDFAGKIRDICEIQLQEEVNVDQSITSVLKTESTQDMMRNSIMKFKL